LAPGWWALLAIILLLITGGIWLLLRRRQARRYRRIALQQARTIYGEWEQHGDGASYLQAINRLLKQTALAAYPRRDIAALNGTAWLDFLDNCLRRPQFGEPAVRALAAVYQPQSDKLSPQELQRAAEEWIRRHRC
jgi:hypothetical protein